MTIKEYTLSDAEAKLEQISNISIFLSTSCCPKEISFQLQDHMQAEIESLQGILSFMRLYPELKARELKEVKPDAA